MSLVEVPEDFHEFNTWAIQERWSDGLPLIPPTCDLVDQMIAASQWPSDQVVAQIPPRLVGATVELIAANAVMAGCLPSAMPILIAAVQAMADPSVNLYGIQATTHPVALMLLVTGPLAQTAGIHGGVGLFGPGFPANASIGRAIRLIQQNIGGAWPGETDRSTQGTPAKFHFCFGENQDDSPWEPFRVRMGFDERESTVTIFGAEGPHNLNDHISVEPKGILFTFAQTMATVGTNNAYCPGEAVLVMGPEHAVIMNDAGLGPRDVQRYLAERVTIPFKHWKIGGMFGHLPQPKHLAAADDDYPVRVFESADEILLIVGGGPGRHSAWMPSLGFCRSATRVISRPDGSRILAV